MTILRGTLKSFDSGTWTASVQLAGSISNYVTVPVSRAIDSAELVAGRSVAVLMFDASNPDDAVLTAVWA
jgi:hypothetical protein